MLSSYNLTAFVMTSDPARAKEFYSEKLGLQFVSEAKHSIIYDANGTKLQIVNMPNHKPVQHTVIGWEVPDIAAAAADLLKAGITFERYSFLEQDEIGLWSSPDGSAKLAWFKDPDGNVLSIAQH